MGKIEDILIDGNQRNASDIHLCPGSPVMFRIDGASDTDVGGKD